MEHGDSVRGRGWESLTKRERQIVLLVVSGHTNKEIATKLGIAENTVKQHVSRTLARTGADTRVDLAVAATRRAARRSEIERLIVALERIADALSEYTPKTSE